jgi:hypothetical protein
MKKNEKLSKAWLVNQFRWWKKSASTVNFEASSLTHGLELLNQQFLQPS